MAPEDIANAPDLAADGPIHMHLAEQVAEVDEIKAAYGQRPVEWLLDNAHVTDQWCLIHCTQMEAHETIALAATGAVAGLCPITESSLGDGIFDGVRWLDAQGKLAIGSDSNIRISLSEELRTLDYSQRLRDRSRAALATAEHTTGRRLFNAACAGGAQAAGRKSGHIAEGYLADLMALDDSHIRPDRTIRRQASGLLDLRRRRPHGSRCLVRRAASRQRGPPPRPRYDYRRLHKGNATAQGCVVSDPQFKSWQAIQAEVLRRIHARDWPPGHTIPNEVDLAREFGCARATVNRALQSLADSGLLERRRKAGTRVALHPVGKATLDIPVLRQEIETRSMTYGYRLVERALACAPAALGTDKTALHLIALHYADDVPYVVEDRWINLTSVPAAAEQPFDRISANEWLVITAPYTRWRYQLYRRDGQCRAGPIAEYRYRRGRLCHRPNHLGP